MQSAPLQFEDYFPLDEEESLIKKRLNHVWDGFPPSEDDKDYETLLISNAFLSQEVMNAPFVLRVHLKQ